MTWPPANIHSQLLNSTSTTSIMQYFLNPTGVLGGVNNPQAVLEPKAAAAVSSLLPISGPQMIIYEAISTPRAPDHPPNPFLIPYIGILTSALGGKCIPELALGPMAAAVTLTSIHFDQHNIHCQDPKSSPAPSSPSVVTITTSGLGKVTSPKSVLEPKAYASVASICRSRRYWRWKSNSEGNS